MSGSWLAISCPAEVKEAEEFAAAGRLNARLSKPTCSHLRSSIRWSSKQSLVAPSSEYHLADPASYAMAHINVDPSGWRQDGAIKASGAGLFFPAGPHQPEELYGSFKRVTERPCCDEIPAACHQERRFFSMCLMLC